MQKPTRSPFPASFPVLLIASCILACFAGAKGLTALFTVGNVHTQHQTNVDFSPLRGEFSPLRLHRTGFTYKCSECHNSINQKSASVLIAEHTDLILDHGTNNYCLNCHHPENRDVYVNHNGSEIPADKPAELCRKCHGIIYRDWSVGAHGKIMGYWDDTQGEQDRLLCIQCHDPHKPKIPKMAPMPGPSLATPHSTEGAHHGEV
jgi:hypothetical protein